MEIQLIDTIASDKITDLVTDSGELLLDNVLDDGILKDIPLVGSVIKIYKTGKSISEYFFLKKLVRFLYQLNTIPLNDRKKFVRKISDDKTFKKEIGEKLIFLIDRIDNASKIDLLAESFKQFILKKITLNTFLDLSYSIEKLKIHYINDFYDIVRLSHQNKSRMVMDHLYQCGFFISTSGGISLGSSLQSGFEISEIGEFFLNEILKVDIVKKRNIHIDYIKKEIPENNEPTDSMKFVEKISIDKFTEALESLSTNDLFKVNVSALGVWFEQRPLYVYTKNKDSVNKYLFK